MKSASQHNALFYVILSTNLCPVTIEHQYQAKLFKMKIFITLLFLSFSGFLNAQTNISGIVREENNIPLDAASVSLMKGSDTLALKNEVTDREGKFSFPAIPAGIYYIRVSSVGYSPVTGPAFTIVSGTKQIELPVFNLKKQSSELQSVSVVLKKPFIEQKSDRIIVNADASPANAGTSVMDLLEKSPGVSVDKDGNISLKGKQGVTCLLYTSPSPRDS